MHESIPTLAPQPKLNSSSIMPNDNLVSIEITPEKKAAIVSAMSALRDELQGRAR